MSYCVIFLVLILELECDVDTVGKFEGGIVVVVNVDVLRSTGVDGDINNQLLSLPERDIIIESIFFGN
jgi:hypothetical protein